MDLQKHARAVSLQQCDAFTKILIVKGLLIVPSKSQALFIRQYPVRGWRDGSELRARGPGKLRIRLDSLLVRRQRGVTENMARTQAVAVRCLLYFSL